MGKEEFAKVLEGIVNDAEQAGKVANGDFGGAQDLTEAEQALLVAAAGDLDGDDVTGFGSNDYILKLGDIDGESKQWKMNHGSWLQQQTPNVRSAFGYIKFDGVDGE